MAQNRERTIRVQYYDTGGYDFDKNEWKPDILLATILVTKDGCKIESQERTCGEGLLSIDVLGSDGERVTSTSDPLRWAGLIDTAFRSGYSYVSVKDVAAAAATSPENGLG
jgi:hypothetical protein